MRKHLTSPFRLLADSSKYLTKEYTSTKNPQSLLSALLENELSMGNDNIIDNKIIKLASECLFNISSLKKYFSLHKISLQDCERIITYATITKLPKGEVVFKQETPVNECLILIKGNISLTYTKPKDQIFNSYLLESNIANEFNYDILHDKEELHFDNNEITEITNKALFISEFNLINKLPHSVNLITKTQCVFLSLNKKNFGIAIKKQLSTFDSNIKVIILNHIKTFLNLPFFDFASLYLTFTKVFANVNDEITVKGKSVSKYFYFIYKGSCVITSPKVDKLKIDKGNFIGLESLTKDICNYKYTIQPTDNNTILIRFSVGDMECTSAGKEILNMLRKELIPLIYKQEQIVEHYMKRNTNNIQSKLTLNNNSNNKVRRFKLLTLNEDEIMDDNERNTKYIKISKTNNFASSSERNIFSKSASKYKKQHNEVHMNISKTISNKSCTYRQINSRFKTISGNNNNHNNHKLFLKSNENILITNNNTINNNEDKLPTEFKTIATTYRSIRPMAKFKTLFLPSTKAQFDLSINKQKRMTVKNELQQPESTKHDMNLYSIDNKENSHYYLNTCNFGNSMNVSTEKDMKLRESFLFRNKKDNNFNISLRKNLGNLFEKNIQKKKQNKIRKKLYGELKNSVVYYRTDRYNIPLVTSLIDNQNNCI